MTSPQTLSALLAQARDAMRRRHLSLRTEEAYLARIRQFIEFHGRHHSNALTAEHVRRYLTHPCGRRPIG